MLMLAKMLTPLGHQPTGNLDSRLMHHRVHDTRHVIHCCCRSSRLKTVNKHRCSSGSTSVCVCARVSARSFPKAVSGPGASQGRRSGRVHLFQMEARQKEGLHLAQLNIVRVDTCGAAACCHRWVIISPPVSKNPLSQAAAPKSVSGLSGNRLVDHFKPQMKKKQTKTHSSI